MVSLKFISFSAYDIGAMSHLRVAFLDFSRQLGFRNNKTHTTPVLFPSEIITNYFEK